MKNILFSVLLFLTSCQTFSPLDYKQWTGKWAGVEGTYLIISPVGNSYNLVISDLDGPKIFKGSAIPQGIQFTRNGKTEVIKSGTGSETGMKWLADKKNCLVIHSGEGYCRID